MTSTGPTGPKRSGPQRGWSKTLWDAHTDVGKADSGYVLSCNRFLKAMVRYRLHETLELIRNLSLHFVLKGEAPDPERYKSHTSGIASLVIPTVSKASDELDIYRVWWAKHVQWDKAKECLCERKLVELDRVYGLLSPEVGEHQKIWRTHPMFLSACVQVARRSLVEDGFTDLEVFTSHGELGSHDPIPAGATLWITINRRLEAYLDSGEWRIDAAPLEDLTDPAGKAFNVKRKPDEDRRDYINRVKDLLDDRLISAMYHANTIALHPKVKLQDGPALNISNRHEEMLVMRLFGAKRREIVAAMPDDAFSKEGGGSVKDPIAAVSARTDRIARYLGFLPAAGGETS